MIPRNSDDLVKDFVYKELPTKTYKLDAVNQKIVGYIDGLEAVKQAIYLILNVERYENIIYSWNYGVELDTLYGKDCHYAQLELKRRIQEALLQDSRIKSVEDFEFEVKREKVHTTFTVKTIYGDIETEKVVTI